MVLSADLSRRLRSCREAELGQGATPHGIEVAEEQLGVELPGSLKAFVGHIREYVSPDNQLRFIVVHDEQDISLGFEGFPWHTHADLLASIFGISEELAVNRYVSDLLNDRCIIVVSWIGGRIHDIWITADPTADLRYKPKDEILEFRYWSGAQWKPI